MVFVWETHGGGSTEDVDPQSIIRRLFRKRILQRSYIERRRVELVRKVGVLLIVRLTVDVDRIEIAVVGTDA